MNPSILDIVVAASPEVPMPPADPLGYAAPVPILLGLAYLTLTLHFLAMNFTVGSGLLLLWTRFRSGPDGVGRFLGSGLPLGVSYLVTLGVPPLLFVQVVYGQQFYSSSVLIGSFWILVIPIIIVAYAGFYYHKLTRDSRPRPQTAVLVIAVLGLLTIGFIYVNNLTLSMSPERWLDAYAARPAGGSLNLGDSTVFPRFLLIVAPSLAVAGLALIIRGAYLGNWGELAAGARSRAFGSRAFGVGMAVEAVAAGLVIATLPERVRAFALGGGTPTILLGIGVLLAIAATVAAFLAARREGLLMPMIAGSGVVGALACFVVLRDLARQEYLRPHFELASVPVHAQWGMLAIFVGTLVVGLALMIYLCGRVFPGMAAARGEEPAA